MPSPISPGPDSWVTFGPSVPFSLTGAILWLAAMMGVQWVAQWAIEHFQFEIPAGLPSLTPHALIMVAFSAALLVWLRGFKGRPLWTIGLTLRRLPGDLLFTAVALLAVGALYLLAGGAVRLYFELTSEAPGDEFRQFLYASMFKDLSFPYLFAVLVLYPVFEEVWFRGVLYPPMRRDFGRMPAVLVTSLLFALAHGHAFPINQFFGGVVFVLAFELRRTLIAPILLHMAGNGSLALMGWLLPKWGVL